LCAVPLSLLAFDVQAFAAASAVPRLMASRKSRTQPLARICGSAWASALSAGSSVNSR
jgi:hypothetical protein